MPECSHPIKSLEVRIGNGWGGESLCHCPCGVTLRLDVDILQVDQDGWAKRSILFARAQNGLERPEFSVEDLKAA